MSGYWWALLSVLLVSSAQLLLKSAMAHLPPVSQFGALWSALLAMHAPALTLLAGLAAYSLSMLSWFLALQRLPLSRAYPLLSLSYVLVWSCAMVLPGFEAVFNWWQLAGVVAVVSGLILICSPVKR